MEWERIELFLIPVLLTEALQLSQRLCSEIGEWVHSSWLPRSLPGPRHARQQWAKRHQGCVMIQCQHKRRDSSPVSLYEFLSCPSSPLNLSSLFCFKNHVPLLRHSWRKPLLPYLHISWTSWNPAKNWRYQKFSQSICCLVLWVNCR